MHTILFDIDGTLLNAQSAGSHTIDRVLKEVFSIQRAMPLRLHGRTDRGILNELLEFHGLESTNDNFQAFQQAYLPLLDQHISQRPSTVLPGVKELLDWLEARDDVALGILTGNMRQGAEIKLKYSGLTDYFQFGGYGDEHPLRDDVAREAKTAAENFLTDRFQEQQVIVIGDTEADITCARAIGAQAIGVLTGGSAADDLRSQSPDHLLEDLSESIPVFESILKS